MALPVMGGRSRDRDRRHQDGRDDARVSAIEFPAVADFELTGCLVDAAREAATGTIPALSGVRTLSTASIRPVAMPVSYDLEQKWEAWLRGGTLASEMGERCALHRLPIARCESRVHSEYHLESGTARQRMDDSESHDTMRGIRVAVEAIKLHIQREREQKL